MWTTSEVPRERRSATVARASGERPRSRSGVEFPVAPAASVGPEGAVAPVAPSGVVVVVVVVVVVDGDDADAIISFEFFFLLSLLLLVFFLFFSTAAEQVGTTTAAAAAAAAVRWGRGLAKKGLGQGRRES